MLEKKGSLILDKMAEGKLTKEQLEKKVSKLNTIQKSVLTAAAALVIGGGVPLTCDTYTHSALDTYNNFNTQKKELENSIYINTKEFGDLYDVTQDSARLLNLATKISNLKATPEYKEAVQGEKGEVDTKGTYALWGVLFLAASAGIGIGVSARKEHYENRLRRVNVGNKCDVE